jgi:hypothetical protein
MINAFEPKSNSLLFESEPFECSEVLHSSREFEKLCESLRSLNKRFLNANLDSLTIARRSADRGCSPFNENGINNLPNEGRGIHRATPSPAQDNASSRVQMPHRVRTGHGNRIDTNEEPGKGEDHNSEQSIV